MLVITERMADYQCLASYSLWKGSKRVAQRKSVLS